MPSPPTDAESFEGILQHVLLTRGFDFTTYKRASLMRRVVTRMRTVGVETFDGYLDYLQAHEEELEALFDAVLINVTSFFRDPEVWEYVGSHVLPALMEGQSAGSPIRIWSAGCAAGQEAYSVAMLLAERVGIEGLRDRVRIHATDVDAEALTEARRAIYSARMVEDVPAPLLAKYFDSSRGSSLLNRELRRSVAFRRLDLLHDAPISRVDFLLCRNTLMYFNPEAQARILARFACSLNPKGFLLLGRPEMLCSHSTVFAPDNLKHRIFRFLAKADLMKYRPGSVAT
jgi:two-component system, chemotaxis family, CheB/CheR fusion protein